MATKIPMRGLRIDDVLYAKICYIAKLNERSFNAQATYYLRQCVEKFEQEYGPVPDHISGQAK